MARPTHSVTGPARGGAAVLALALAGCGDGTIVGNGRGSGSPPGPPGPQGGGGSGGAGGGAAADAGAADSGRGGSTPADSGSPPDAVPGSTTKPDCSDTTRYPTSHFSTYAATPNTRDDMFCVVNWNRRGYEMHGRWKGMPVIGAGHGDFTWPIEMAWDPALNALAQAEAERVSKGGAPKGAIPIASDDLLPAYYDAVDTADYTITATKDRAEAWYQGGALSPHPMAPLGSNVPQAREGVYYHDAGSGGAIVKRLGIGLVVSGSERTWVLRFAP